MRVETGVLGVVSKQFRGVIDPLFIRSGSWWGAMVGRTVNRDQPTLPIIWHAACLIKS